MALSYSEATVRMQVTSDAQKKRWDSASGLQPVEDEGPALPLVHVHCNEDIPALGVVRKGEAEALLRQKSNDSSADAAVDAPDTAHLLPQRAVRSDKQKAPAAAEGSPTRPTAPNDTAVRDWAVPPHQSNVHAANPTSSSSTPSSSYSQSCRETLITATMLNASKDDYEIELQGLRKRRLRHLKTTAANAIVDYYRQQKSQLEAFSDMDTVHARWQKDNEDGDVPGSSQQEAQLRRERADMQEVWALRISYATNIVLLAVKIFATVKSGSLSIATSALDSFLDIISGTILIATAMYTRQKRSKYLYPIGTQRMQPLGVIVFSSIMGTMGFSVLVEGVRQLAGPSHTHHLEPIAWTVSIMCSVIAVKFVLYLWCRGFKSSSVNTYAQDHLNDVLTNTVGLVMAILGDRIASWIDPLGAILLAMWIVRQWVLVALENLYNLVGMAAPPEFMQRITYLCWHHSEKIHSIDTVRCYTFGDTYFAEVDVVLPADMPLREAHDIGESLQEKIESLSDVERAFVHLDYESTHKPEHAS